MCYHGHYTTSACAWHITTNLPISFQPSRAHVCQQNIQYLCIISRHWNCIKRWNDTRKEHVERKQGRIHATCSTPWLLMIQPMILTWFSGFFSVSVQKWLKIYNLWYFHIIYRNVPSFGGYFVTVLCNVFFAYRRLSRVLYPMYIFAHSQCDNICYDQTQVKTMEVANHPFFNLSKTLSVKGTTVNLFLQEL